MRPFQVQRVNVCYWREKIPGTYSADQRFPCFILNQGTESGAPIYGLPSHEYPGLVKVGPAPAPPPAPPLPVQAPPAADACAHPQVCNHLGRKADPDRRDRKAEDWDVDMLRRFVARVLPGLIPEPAVVETCMYTVRRRAFPQF